MIKNNKKVFFFGLGSGVILAASIYFFMLLLTGYNHPEKNFEDLTISDNEVIERAEALGMIRLSDFLDGNYKTEEEDEEEDSNE